MKLLILIVSTLFQHKITLTGWLSFILVLFISLIQVKSGPTLEELDYVVESTKVKVESLRIKPQAYGNAKSYSVVGDEGVGQSLIAGDLLVGINEYHLTEQDFETAISQLYVDSQPVNGKKISQKKQNVLVFPLVFHDEVDESTGGIPQEGLPIGAFIKIEVIEAKNMTIRPTGKHREDLWAAKEAEMQAERARVQAELDEKRRIAEQIQAEDRRKKERADKREQMREVNARRRFNGEGFSYDAELLEEDEGGFGIFFAEDTEQPIVSEVLKGFKGSVEGVAKGDALVSVNGIDVTKMRLDEVVATITDAEFPKTLNFVVFKRGEEVRVQTSFEFFVTWPPLLAGPKAIKRPEKWGGNITAFDPCIPVSLGYVSPRFGCKKISLPTRSDGAPHPMIFAARGECTFTDKVRAIQAEGAQMVVVVNTDNGVIDMPAGRMKTGDITAPVAMIGQKDGEYIERMLTMGYNVEAVLAPQHLCDLDTEVLIRNDEPPRHQEDSGGGLIVMSPSVSRIFDFADALFGPPAIDNEIVPIVFVYPPDGCNPDEYEVRVRGAYAAIQRGVCAFSQKTIIAQQLGAVGVIILNTDAKQGVIRAMGNPDDDDLLRIPTVMISKRAADVLQRSADKGEQMLGRFIHTDFDGKYG